MAITQVCTHLELIRNPRPKTKGCEECLKMGDTWVHLRLCENCGHVGCCDSSKNKHATKHFRATGHPIVKSLERGGNWMYCYLDDVMFEVVWAGGGSTPPFCAPPQLGGEGAFRFGRLDLDYFAKPVDGFDGVVEGDCAVGRNEVRDLQVITPALEPGKRRHTEHATPHRLRVLLGERREIRRLDVLLPARDVQSGALGYDAMGRMLIEGQMVFVAGALEGGAEPIPPRGAPAPRGRAPPGS